MSSKQVVIRWENPFEKVGRTETNGHKEAAVISTAKANELLSTFNCIKEKFAQKDDSSMSRTAQVTPFKVHGVGLAVLFNWNS